VARDLYARLKNLRTVSEKTAQAASSGTDGNGRKNRPAGPGDAGQGVSTGRSTTEPAGFLPGWDHVSDLVFSRRVAVPLDGPAGRRFQSSLLGRPVPFTSLCFMDTETTGLSGGAGTAVFLVGSGTYSQGTVVVEQTFLADFPGEPEYLSRVREQLWAGDVWVTYNGKAFDSRLLETRFLMNGRSVELPEQLDLLYWSRRLWRRLIGPCGLDDIEREVLHVNRGLDVSGFEIPERYFEFLRTGDALGLEAVIAHHLQDIVSLVALFFVVESIIDDARENRARPEDSHDRVALACFLASTADPACEPQLRSVILSPHPHEHLEDRERCARALARYYRRTGRAQEVLRVWSQLWRDGSVRAGIEVAKYAEHQLRDARASLELVETLLTMASDTRTIAELKHRAGRLRRKLSR
jgi:uncharacterized protein YprB with RNaseH-like and TPR domain